MKTPYLKIPKKTFEEFNLSYDKLILIGINNSTDYLGHIYELTEEELNGYIESVLPKENFDIKKYENKKAFIIQGSSKTSARMTNILKPYNIKLVSDYKKADFYITNSNTNCAFSKNNTFFKINSSKWYKMLKVTHAGYNLRGIGGYINTASLADKSYQWRRMKGYYIGGTYFNILMEKKDLVHESLFVNLHPSIEITEDLSKQLISMIESADKSNFSIVKKIIPTIDPGRNQMILFEFLQNINIYKHHFNKDKDCKGWFKNLGVWDRMKTENLIIALHQQNKLTKEGFKFLEKESREDIRLCNRKIYSFKVNLKDEFKKYI